MGFTVLLLTFSCKKDQTDHSHRTRFFKNITTPALPFDSLLTVVIYNIQLGFPVGQDPWDPTIVGCTPDHLDSLFMVMQELDPDIILLQEVPHNRPNTVIRDFTQLMAEKLNMNYAFGSHGYNEAYTGRVITGEWGNAIFSKYPITEIENRETFYLDKWVRRSTLKAVLDLGNNIKTDVFSLHHLPSGDDEMDATAQFIDESANPVIVGGDFNRGFGHPEFDKLMLQNTFAGAIPFIDRIYTSTNFDSLSIGIIEKSKGISDHWAFYADLKYN